MARAQAGRKGRPHKTPSPLGRFKFLRPVKVMFRDLDGMRHVNHAVYLSYAEAARNEYWMHVTGIQTVDQYDFVLAELTARYHAAAQLGDELIVGCRVTQLRRSSFLMEHEIRKANSGELVFSMSSAQVMFDYKKGASMPISDQRRKQIEDFEGSARLNAQVDSAFGQHKRDDQS